MKSNLTILCEIPQLRKDLYSLFCGLKKGIGPEDFVETGDGNIPGVDVTIGCTFDFERATIDWAYQTGCNEYTGGAYGHPEWFTCSVMKRTNCKELANDIINEIHGRIAELSMRPAEVVA